MGTAPPFDARWAWFLDIDGTLLDIAAIPSAVKTGPSDTRLVTGLYSECRGALALISGRSIEGIDKLFYPLRLPAAGQHGIERRDAKGRVRRHPFPEDAMRRAAEEIRAFVERHEGLLFEDKGASLAVHYRLAPQYGAAAHAILHKAAQHLGEGVEVQGGKMVVELKPSGQDKGLAIQEFMKEPPFRGRVPVFLGDDLTDEDGFHVVNRLGGHSVKIGSGVTSARWRLRDAAAVRRWLSEALYGSTKDPSPGGRTPSPSPSRP
ncbi:MAG: trehalose-phosphatase [Betaproteobacteria bacterium]|nr:trehalose-phosphatase [Betaproteobacteria bacterium]